jgi:hypothetical protein
MATGGPCAATYNTNGWLTGELNGAIVVIYAKFVDRTNCA